MRATFVRLISAILIASSLALSAPPPARGQSAEDVQKATKIAEQTLSLARRGLGHEHPSTLLSISSLAFGYQPQGRYGEAEPLYKRALRTSEPVLGREHPDTLTNPQQFRGLYYTQGRYDEAEPLYKRALQVRKRVLGREHPDYSDAISTLY